MARYAKYKLFCHSSTWNSEFASVKGISNLKFMANRAKNNLNLPKNNQMQPEW